MTMINMCRRYKHGLRTSHALDVLVMLCLVILVVLSYELSRRYATDDAPPSDVPLVHKHTEKRRPPKIALPYKLPLSGRHGKIGKVGKDDKKKTDRNTKHHKKGHHGGNESRPHDVDVTNHNFNISKHAGHRKHKVLNESESLYLKEAIHKGLNDTRSNHRGRLHNSGRRGDQVVHMSSKRRENRTKHEQVQHGDREGGKKGKGSENQTYKRGEGREQHGYASVKYKDHHTPQHRNQDAHKPKQHLHLDNDKIQNHERNPVDQEGRARPEHGGHHGRERVARSKMTT